MKQSPTTLKRRAIPKVPGLDLSEIGFGCAPIGGYPQPVSLESASTAIRLGVKLGINWCDSAVLYGCGKSLRYVGHALDVPEADHVLVTTKVGRRPIPRKRGRAKFDIYREPDPFDLVFDYSAHSVDAAIEFSLERLKRETIDLVFVHDPDAEDVPRFTQVIRETLPALRDHKSAGRIRAIGVGMNQWEMLRLFVTEADIDVVLVAGCYNIVEQGALELFPFCAERRVAVLNGGVFGSGILAASAGAKSSYRYGSPSRQVRKKVAEFRKICTRHDVSPRAAALQFARAPKDVTAIPLGAVSCEQVRSNLQHLATPIPSQFWVELAAACALPRETIASLT